MGILKRALGILPREELNSLATIAGIERAWMLEKNELLYRLDIAAKANPVVKEQLGEEILDYLKDIL